MTALYECIKTFTASNGRKFHYGETVSENIISKLKPTDRSKFKVKNQARSSITDSNNSRDSGSTYDSGFSSDYSSNDYGGGDSGSTHDSGSSSDYSSNDYGGGDSGGGGSSDSY